MSKSSILVSLLGKGYFPKELPPVFTTTDFGDAAEDILQEWQEKELFKRKAVAKAKVPEKKTKVTKQGAYTYELPKPEPELISCPKKGYERRNISITHPVPQALLSSEINENRAVIAKWLMRNQYSIDCVQISSVYGRGIRPLNFSAHNAKKAYIEAQSDWIVRTDITRFYPSIYTHSITWAAYGKEKVKTNLKLFEGSLGDRLDLLVRSCNRNQTVGLPIGPETSRILADIVSTRIDSDFSSVIASIDEAQVDRLQDDWFLGAPTLEAAEAALSTITSCYREYGLDINGSKTAVESTLSPLSETWITELGAFLSHGNARLTRTRLREFLHLVLRLQLDYPKDPVVSYGLSVIESRRSSIQDVETLESFLIRAATAAPGALNRICSVLINLHHDTHGVSLSRVRARFTTLAERNLINGNLYEVIWLLFTLRGLKIPFKSKTFCSALEQIESSSLILLLLDMKNRGQVQSKLPVSNWEDAISAERIMTDWSWLYAYEGIRKGWLQDKNKVMKHPFFASLDSRDVVFYDPRRNVVRSSKTVQKRNRQRRLNLLDTLQLVARLRGIHLAEYADE